MDVSKIGNKIKEKRIALGMTQKDLANEINVSAQLISKWETGESIPSLEYIDLLCKALKIELVEFLSQGEVEPLESAPSEPKKKEKKFKWNWKLFFIIGGSVLAAGLIVAITLLSIYVFVPKTNLKNYVNQVQATYEKYLDQGFFNIRVVNEIDGDEEDNNVFSGYIDEDNNCVFYKGDEKMTYRDNIVTLDDVGIYKYAYKIPRKFSGLEDFMYFVVFDDDHDDPMGIDCIKYMRKKSSTEYYIELNEDYITKDMDGSLKKNIKFTDKVKGYVKTKDGYIGEMSATAKFKNTKENEGFTVVTTITFDRTRPVIEHTDLDGRTWGSADMIGLYLDSELDNSLSAVSKQDFINTLAGKTAKKLDVSEQQAKDITSGKLHYEDGQYFFKKSNGVTFCNFPSLTTKSTFTPEGSSASIDSVHLYGGVMYYSIEGSGELRAKYYNTGTTKNIAITFDRFAGIDFNDRYVWYTLDGLPQVVDLSTNSVVIPGDKKLGYNATVGYVDSSGRVYYSEDGSVYVYSLVTKSNKKIIGDSIDSGYVQSPQPDEVYTYSSSTKKVYVYKNGALIDEFDRYSNRKISLGSFSVLPGDDSLFFNDGTKRELNTLAYTFFKDSDGESRKFRPRYAVTAVNGMLCVTDIGFNASAIYRANDLLNPVCIVDEQLLSYSDSGAKIITIGKAKLLVLSGGTEIWMI